ncbi:hypothetical protein [Cellulosimicrobium sp. CUA-896]|uniref:hypothetical protein n=1 Tax=Cellulosimicrobium sp. CUA-896 TaxID=1517881 RepID=UPI000967F54D|nr:hypothetical protein [Cellulosimicrobium sp. CUA-896]OLT55442.1 hypothetical protein BJF88_06300 [Cellulosimicrobium sp. CUA-896]
MTSSAIGARACSFACAAIAAVLLTAGCGPSDTASDAPSSTAPGTSGTDLPLAPTLPEPTPSTSAPAEPTVEPGTDGPAPTTRPDDDTSDGASAEPTPTDVTLAYLEFDEAARSVLASGWVAVLEESGTCTLTLSNGGRTLSDEVSALPDATTTSCGGLEITSRELAPGTWTAVLHYESSTGQRSSAPREVEIP